MVCSGLALIFCGTTVSMVGKGLLSSLRVFFRFEGSMSSSPAFLAEKEPSMVARRMNTFSFS